MVFWTYWRTLSASDARSTPVTLHAPRSSCARWALNARLTSVAFRAPVSRFSRVTDLRRTHSSGAEECYKAAKVFRNLTDSKK